MASVRDGRGFWTRVVRGAGGWPRLLRLALTPLSWVYGAAVQVRNWMFDAGLRQVRRLPAPVLSIGNITAGGAPGANPRQTSS
ncbi:MAG TPA: tetraacyldisaccharide 4'-kinase, partial [Candidatus Brocadiia bacterium]|nr:tetraacyldisaccharide 4'-kinase [Candidatus Brocadiia bacterium]